MQINALPFADACRLFKQLRDDMPKYYCEQSGELVKDSDKNFLYFLTGFQDLTANLVKRTTGKDDEWLNQFSIDEVHGIALEVIQFHFAIVLTAINFAQGSSAMMLENIRIARKTLAEIPDVT